MTDTSLVKQQKGYSVQNNDNSLFIPKVELLAVGCKNCVWKINGQCHKKHQMVDYGICDELVQFISSLANKGDSLTQVWEKFHIYKARLQEAEDYKDFHMLNKKLQKREKELFDKSKTDVLSGEEKESFEKLKMDKTAAKMWWVRLNDHVVKSLQKVADREHKANEGGRLPGIMMKGGTINFVGDKKEIEKKDA